MEYKQRHGSSYNPLIYRLSIGNYSVLVNYSEITDESCLAFSHVHTDYEIYYCLEGTLNLNAGDKRIEMPENSFTILQPGVYHYPEYEPKSPKRYFIFVFEMPVKMSSHAKTDIYDQDDEYLEKAIQYIDTQKIVNLTDQFNSREIIEKLDGEMKQSLPGQKEIVRSLYTQFLVQIFRNFDIYKENTNGLSLINQGNVNLALELTRYMHDHYSQNISINDAAEAFHISERHVGRIFDKYFGKSFKHTLNIYRINYAKNYLLDTDLSIEKISDLVGIPSTRKFHQLFQEIEDMTASEYRRQHKKIG